MDEVGPSIACRAFGRAPQVPLAGTSTASMVNEKLQIDLLSLGDIAALRVMDVAPTYSFLAPARPANPPGAWDFSSASRFGIFGPPKCIQMGEWARRQNDVRADYCSGPRIKLLLQGVDACPWVRGRRNGLVCGNYTRLFADDRFAVLTSPL